MNYLIIIALLALTIGWQTNQKGSENNFITKNKLAMENKDYTTSFVVNKDVNIVFDAINNFRAWWSEDIEGPTDQLNEVFFYHYKDIHFCKMKLVEMVPSQKLVYQVMDNHFSFTEDKTEWIDTKLIFELSQEGDQTRITFTHKGLVPEYECYQVCYDAWGFYINKSLFNLISTGKGEPNRKDMEGFNDRLAEKWKLNEQKKEIKH